MINSLMQSSHELCFQTIVGRLDVVATVEPVIDEQPGSSSSGGLSGGGVAGIVILVIAVVVITLIIGIVLWVLMLQSQWLIPILYMYNIMYNIAMLSLWL